MKKGSNHHVMPSGTGWTVISDGHQSVVPHFKTREKAIDYATQCAQEMEGHVLVHSTDKVCLSTVSLPQQESLKELISFDVQDSALKAADYHMSDYTRAEDHPTFDPWLGYDECYFEL
jgi:hypothetical protein